MDSIEKDALKHIIALADLEWNGMITLTHFRDRIQSIVTQVLPNDDNKPNKNRLKPKRRN